MGVIGGLLIGTLLGLTVGPHTPTLGEDSTGDEALVADVRAVAGQRPRPADPVRRPGPRRPGQPSPASAPRTAGSPTPQTPYELGSITKTFTGMLLADAVQRGEMAVEDRLAEHLPELAGHPGRRRHAVAAGHPQLRPARRSPRTGSGHPAGRPEQREPVRRLGRGADRGHPDVELTNPGEYAYSNLGMSLLGHAEARAAGAADWPTLATERLLTPAGDDRDHVRADRGRASPPARSAGTRRTAGGRPTGTAPAYRPGRLLDLVDRRGHDALRPGGAGRPGAGDGGAGARGARPTTGEIGLAWHTSEVERPGDHLAQRRHRRACTPCWPWTGSAARR